MHPAPSVIFFTAFSGLGFGLLAFLGLGLPDVTGWVAFAFFFIAYGLAVGGLLASVFHLANPKNAIKAFSQWRTSWLSREGIVAVAALLVLAPVALGRLVLDAPGQAGWVVALGWIGALLSLGTVACTAMIYTHLRAVPRWNMALTPVLFLANALAGGALLAGQVRLAGVLMLVLGAVQLAVWIKGDRRFAEVGSTMETATGLGPIGRVRLLEPPHGGENYLLREMGYQVGRKHALKLRWIALGLMCALPALLLLVFPAGHLLALVAVLSHVAGLLAARWLFFAQAEHVQALFYGRGPV